MARINMRRIVVSLMVGVVVTVLVAWGLDRFTPAAVNPSTIPPLVWPVGVPSDWPMVPDSAEHQLRAGATYEFHGANLHQAWETKFADPAVTLYTQSEKLYGWPCRALGKWSGGTRTLNIVTDLDVGTMRAGMPWPANWPTARTWDDDRLPVYPLWPGFALNTLFYGAFARVALAGVSHVKNRRRPKPGMCPVCRYPISGLIVCPECGTSVSHAMDHVAIASKSGVLTLEPPPSPQG